MKLTLICVYDRVAKRWSHPMPVESVDVLKRDLAISLSKMEDSEPMKACKEDYEVYVVGSVDDSTEHFGQPLSVLCIPEFCFSFDDLEVQ